MYRESETPTIQQSVQFTFSRFLEMLKHLTAESAATEAFVDRLHVRSIFAFTWCHNHRSSPFCCLTSCMIMKIKTCMRFQSCTITNTTGTTIIYTRWNTIVALALSRQFSQTPHQNTFDVRLKTRAVVVIIFLCWKNYFLLSL